MQKLVKLFSFLLVFSLMVGCGGEEKEKTAQQSQIQPQQPEKPTQPQMRENSIKVIDGYIKGAVVKDSGGQKVSYVGDGEYNFETKPTGTIYVYGGSFEGSDVKNKFDYKVDAKYKIVSPLTHFVTNYPSQKENLLKALGINETDLNEDFYAKLKANKSDVKFQNIAKVAQIFYALEVNDLLKSLKNFSTFQDIVDNALNLSSAKSNATSLILKAKELSPDNLLNAENHLASIKTKLYSDSDKVSGIRLDGEWKMVGMASRCRNDQLANGKETISYSKEVGYTIKSITEIKLHIGWIFGCSTEDVTKKPESERTKVRIYKNIKYPLPVSEFNNAVELSKILTDLDHADGLDAKGLGVTLISPDKFINKSETNRGTTTAIYTRIK